MSQCHTGVSSLSTLAHANNEKVKKGNYYVEPQELSDIYNAIKSKLCLAC